MKIRYSDNTFCFRNILLFENTIANKIIGDINKYKKIIISFYL